MPCFLSSDDVFATNLSDLSLECSAGSRRPCLRYPPPLVLFLSCFCLVFVLFLSCVVSCFCLVFFVLFLSLSCLVVFVVSCFCLVFVLFLSCFCLVFVLFLSCFCLVFVLFLSCFCLVFVLFLSCFCLVFVLFLSCFCLVFVFCRVLFLFCFRLVSCHVFVVSCRVVSCLVSSLRVFPPSSPPPPLLAILGVLYLSIGCPSTSVLGLLLSALALGLYYYWNIHTSETVWKLPEGAYETTFLMTILSKGLMGFSQG
jgi:hypothetical protein